MTFTFRSIIFINEIVKYTILRIYIKVKTFHCSYPKKVKRLHNQLSKFWQFFNCVPITCYCSLLWSPQYTSYNIYCCTISKPYQMYTSFPRDCNNYSYYRRLARWESLHCRCFTSLDRQLTFSFFFLKKKKHFKSCVTVDHNIKRECSYNNTCL